MNKCTKIPKLTNIEDINKNTELMTTSIQTEIKNCSFVPKQSFTQNVLPGDIKLEIETKKIFRTEWQKSRDPKTKKMYNAQIKYVNN